MKTAAQTAWNPRYLVLTGLVLFVFFCAFSINKPLTTDEVELSGAALAIAKTGIPLYYNGDSPAEYRAAKDLWILRETPREQFQYGMWHSSLLYLYSLALFLKVFGAVNWAARMPGVICFLLTLWLLRGILLKVYPTEKAEKVFGFTALLYLINPLLLQQGLMLDLDNTVVTVTCVLFLHEFLRLDLKGVPWLRKYGWLTLVMALGFWAKEFPPIYLTVALLVYLALQRRWRDCIGAFLTLVVGAALFWCSWWAFCRLMGLPVMYFIKWSIIGILGQGEGLFTTILKDSGMTNALFSVFFSFLHPTLWVSPYYMVLFFLVAGKRFWAFLCQRRLEPLDLLLLYAALLFFVTMVYRPEGWFLKHNYPSFGILTLLFAVFVHEHGGPLSWRELLAGMALAIGIAVAQVLILRDVVLTLFRGGLKALGDWHLTAFYVMGVVVLLAIVRASRQQWSVARCGLAALVLGLVGANLGLSWMQRAPYVTSISWNNYGETGFTEAAAYLKSMMKPDDVVICRKDFGYFLQKDLEFPYRKWFNPCVLDSVKSPDELVRNITGPGVRTIVLDRYAIGYSMQNRHVPVLQVVQQFYRVDKQIGSFYILRRANFH